MNPKSKNSYVWYYDIEKVCGKVYEDFIRYALKTSSTFTFITCGDDPVLSYTEGYMDHIIENIEFCRKHDIDIKGFLMRTLSSHWLGHDEELNALYNCFLAGLEPFLIEISKRPPYDVIHSEEVFEHLYKADESLSPLLLESRALLNWKFPLMPENLCFYRNNECWVNIISHERMLHIRPKDEAERDLLHAMGLVFCPIYHYDCESLGND